MINLGPAVQTCLIVVAAVMAVLFGQSASAQPAPQFSREATYRSIRPRLMAAGWVPVRLPFAEACTSSRCDGFEEVIYCSGAGQAICQYSWHNGGRWLLVYARGEGEQRFSGLQSCGSITQASGLTQCNTAQPAVARTTRPRTSASRPTPNYNDLVQNGNAEAARGRFIEAIRYWEQAIPLDRSGAARCRGESLRVSIQAARDTIAAARQPGRLAVLPGEAIGSSSEPAVVRWFRSRESALWFGNPCNLP